MSKPETKQEDETKEFITIAEALQLIPGLTRGHLAQLRYTGKGPKFYKPTPRTVLYRKNDILAWLESTAMTSTAEENI